ncbi:NTP transferase domain-containing protein [Salisediminibacterium halotolerans]|uniref:NTP transferase domain-containing protein n=1 Tax=Salisediminibacterium halotolerans TaxID=517425 RepID=UPI000EAE7345|nr:NTP transferase domain-containing protein [Salisediminibacterium halotolerans]RLJ74400.1 bifunctional UDP-N-acetylglucosamine pyrophosphorylase/glucosamine-1-phosphate N-acetyltransferase [Actinophytocola xinjiangensis]RPE87507.1 bifunctional UDP-N-acetylglucosamine pyrophosphorylase/glucosamine-1-phosphate N-acetyltransferase [Salisediminibacterium halotolerans]TWG35237.1 bifunctional UDP-N-acetylglucosamine pyrophosphorylase/glucosamine-1-phosphate N-acetyltransferase [Salisediminibacterium
MNTAVILAAGNGRKMWPYSVTKAKPALPVAGKPVISHLIDQLTDEHVGHIIAVIRADHSSVRSILAAYKQITVVTVSSSSGTAESLEAALEHVEEENFALFYGDLYLTPKRMAEWLQACRKTKASACLLTGPYGAEMPQETIGAALGKNGRVANIVAHPRPHYVSERVIGAFLLDKEDIREGLKQQPGLMTNVPTGVMPPDEGMIEQALQHLIENGNYVKNYSIADGFVDLDKPWDIMKANHTAVSDITASLTASNVPASSTLDKTADVRGYVVMGQNSHIGKYVRINGNAVIGSNTVIDHGVVIDGPAVIGDNCSITHFAKIAGNSSIGSRNRIGHCAEFSGVSFPNVSFIHYGEVFGVVGEATDIAAGVTIGMARFDDTLQVQTVAGRKEFPDQFGNAVFFGDFVRTGIMSMFMPGVKIGARSVVGSGVCVEQDVASETLLYQKQTLIEKPWGAYKYGW